jgi:hypothetical protein
METTENTQIESFRRVCWIKITNQRGTRSSYDIQQESLKETPPKLPHENSKKKAPKITKKEKREEHNQALRNHTESSIHTMNGSYKV